TNLFKQALAKRYGNAWTRAGARWALCPSKEFFPKGLGDDRSGPYALCMAQFKSAGRWRFISQRVDQGDPDPVFDKPFTRTWTREGRRRAPSCARLAGVHGTIESNDGTCESLMIGDLAYEVHHHLSTKRVGQHGTDLAGFDKVATYRCRSRGRTITCTNQMG